jgi:hypothetical protein
VHRLLLCVNKAEPAPTVPVSFHCAAEYKLLGKTAGDAEGVRRGSAGRSVTALSCQSRESRTFKLTGGGRPTVHTHSRASYA